MLQILSMKGSSELLSQTNHQKQGCIADICSQFVGDEHLQLIWSALQKNQEIFLNVNVDSTWGASDYFAIWISEHTQGIPKRDNYASPNDWN